MVKIENLKALAGECGLEVIGEFLNSGFYKVCYQVNNVEYFIKRILITSLFNEKNSYEIVMSNQIEEGFDKSEYYFIVGLMLSRQMCINNPVRFVEQNNEAMNILAEDKKVIVGIPHFKNVKSSWWMKLFLNVENGPYIFGKVLQNDLDFYLVSNDVIKNDGDISIVVIEVANAVSNDFLKKALISVDIKIKNVVDIMPTNNGKVLYLLEIDGVYNDKSPQMSLSFDFESVLFQFIKKVGGYYLEYNGEEE